MNRVLQEIFRMGVEGSLVLLIVWLAGSLLRCCKAPARPVALLWLAACFRLLSPFSFQLNLSAIFINRKIAFICPVNNQ